MTPRIQAALKQLVEVTGREYQVKQDGNTYALIIPGGGAYPPVGENEMMARLINLRICAEGRGAR